MSSSSIAIASSCCFAVPTRHVLSNSKFWFNLSRCQPHRVPRQRKVRRLQVNTNERGWAGTLHVHRYRIVATLSRGPIRLRFGGLPLLISSKVAFFFLGEDCLDNNTFRISMVFWHGARKRLLFRPRSCKGWRHVK